MPPDRSDPMSHPELRLTVDHLSLSVADLDTAKAFYTAALAPLGLAHIADVPKAVAGAAASGFGIGRKGTLWIMQKGQQQPPAHICFRARTRAEVRAFHAAATAAGGADNGPPGVRHAYHEAYYAAFVIDPEGHNIEAVCFEPEAD